MTYFERLDITESLNMLDGASYNYVDAMPDGSGEPPTYTTGGSISQWASVMMPVTHAHTLVVKNPDQWMGGAYVVVQGPSGANRIKYSAMNTLSASISLDPATDATYFLYGSGSSAGKPTILEEVELSELPTAPEEPEPEPVDIPEYEPLDFLEYCATKLARISTEQIYVQPPNNITMNYPCFVVATDYLETRRADNHTYKVNHRAVVTHISQERDGTLYHRVLSIPSAAFDRSYVSDNLYHDVFKITT